MVHSLQRLLPLGLAVTCVVVALADAQFRAVKVAGTPTDPLPYPACLACAPDGRIFITERHSGRVRIYDVNGKTLLRQPFATLQNTVADGERGLLGIALSRDWPRTKHVFVFHHYAKSATLTLGRIVRFTASGNTGVNPVTILDNITTNRAHNGGYLAIGPDDKLYVTSGDIGRTQNAQNATPGIWEGKLHRLELDGTIPRDNPWGPNSTYYCLGIRNSFGITFHPGTDQLYESENGPRTDDELQLIRAKGNYGWPIELGNQNKPGFDKPMLTWTPVIAPCGLSFYRGTRYPAAHLYRLWVADLKGSGFRVLELGGNPADRVLAQTRVTGVGRPTDIQQASDGFQYATRHSASGALFRIEWAGTPPRLPDLSSVGTPKIGNRVLISHRGKPGRATLLIIGPRQNPVTTPWGNLEVLPLVIVSTGSVPANGVSTVPLPIPNSPALVGLTVSFQSLELEPTNGALTNPWDVRIQ